MVQVSAQCRLSFLREILQLLGLHRWRPCGEALGAAAPPPPPCCIAPSFLALRHPNASTVLLVRSRLGAPACLPARAP